MKRITIMAITGVLAISMLAACNDDDGAEDAEALGDAYVEFTTALNGTQDINVAADETKDRLKDNCDELAGAVDDDEFDDMCDDLDDAVDDEDQPKFDAVKAQYGLFDAEVRAAVAAEVGDVAGDGVDDPLQGGDPGDDGDDDNDDVDGDDDRDNNDDVDDDPLDPSDDDNN